MNGNRTAYLKKKEFLYSVMKFIDGTENTGVISLFIIFVKHEILKDNKETFSILQLLSKVLYISHFIIFYRQNSRNKTISHPSKIHLYI